MSKLFEPLQIGNVKLQQRIVMAPLTRFRADDNGVPLDFVKEYYQQRASVPGTMLLTEATFISARAGGYPNAPGIYTDAQIKGWKEITDAVHAKKSHIWLQLWALGRASNAEELKKQGLKLQSSSDVPMDKDSPAPEPMTEEDIQQYIKDYAQAAKNAIAAGFDGVEIHGANGYLIDQFIQDVSNKRTDAWGGSVEKRARFAIEVAKSVVAAVGHERTGIRLSPFSPWQGMRMADPVPQFSYLAEQLKEIKLAYLHVIGARVGGILDVESPKGKVDFLVHIWANTSPVLLAGGYNSESAREALQQFADFDVAIVFGRYFISNPDLVFKIKEGIELTPYQRDTFYDVGAKAGYIDYPFSKEFLAAKL